MSHREHAAAGIARSVERYAAIPCLKVKAAHAEGIVWDSAAKHLLFVDIPAGRVYRHEPSTGLLKSFDVGRDVSAVHPTTAPDTLLLAIREGAALWSGELHTLVAPLSSRPHVRMNDGNVDPRGRFFVGSMAYDMRPGAAALYRLIGNQLSTVLTELTISNGIDWSPSGDTGYFVDSPTGNVATFTYDLKSGTLGELRHFVTIPAELGLPDGLAVDADGGVWVAIFGGGCVQRFSPDGDLDLVVEVPGAQLVTSCCFGGEGLATLYISTSTESLSASDLAAQPGAGWIYQAATGVVGKPAVPFQLPPTEEHSRP